MAYTYTRAQQLEIETAMAHPATSRLLKRYTAVHLHMAHKTFKEIGQLLCIEPHTISHYVRAYQAGGLSALIPKKQRGVPLKLTPDQLAILQTVILEQTPDDVGFTGRHNWTAKLVQSWLKESFNVSYALSSVNVVLHRLGLTYTRPTYVLKKANLKQQAEFKEAFSAEKKLIDQKIEWLLFEDESSIRDYQAIQKSWFLKGQQRLIPTYGKHASVKLLGILDYEHGDVYVEEHERFDAPVFLAFLQQVLVRYPKGNIVMILDNARIHHAKLLRPFLEGNPRLTLLFLPPYSPKLNMIEGLWKWLKESCINNAFFSTKQEISKAVQTFIQSLDGQNHEIIDRLCVQY